MTLNDKIKNGEFLDKNFLEEDRETEEKVEAKLKKIFKDQPVTKNIKQEATHQLTSHNTVRTARYTAVQSY